MDALDNNDSQKLGQGQGPGQGLGLGREEDDVDVRVRKSSYISCYTEYHVTLPLNTYALYTYHPST